MGREPKLECSHFHTLPSSAAIAVVSLVLSIAAFPRNVLAQRLSSIRQFALSAAGGSPQAAERKPSPAIRQFITVAKNVQLEVLDWGGTGRPIVFLAGLGFTAHDFDDFAPQLTSKYHVYGITRRGFGASSVMTPSIGNYTSDQLGDDVLAVIDALRLDHPVLMGHSIAGEELSSVGSRHPEKIAGLVYLDAGYGYAYFDEAHPDYTVSVNELRDKLGLLRSGISPQHTLSILEELTNNDIPRFQTAAKHQTDRLKTLPQSSGAEAPITIPEAVINGEGRYGAIHCPILAIYALPHMQGDGGDPKERVAADEQDLKITGTQADAFAAAMPQARIVRIPHANHSVWKSNGAEVLREIEGFLASLPQ